MQPEAHLTEEELLARRHILAPAEDLSKLGKPHRIRPMLSHGDRIYLFDTAGRRFIDGPGGMWCNQVGYNRKEIAQAISAQALRLSYNSPWYFTNSPMVELAARIAKHTPGDLNRIFFTADGSTAVDSALRFVEFYNNRLGRPQKKRIIVQTDGYHGSTQLTAACSGRVANWAHFDIQSDRIAFLSSPHKNRASNLGDGDFLEALANEFEDTLTRLGPDTVAAFLAEPILASGGVIVPPTGYHTRFKAICEAHDILYISDEVVTGFGRCGDWFASESIFGVRPDLLTFAKGVTSGYVPLGGFAVSDRVMAKISGDGAAGSYFTNGYTYSGHPVSCAAALANMDIIEAEGLLEHVRSLMPYFDEQLRRLTDIPLVAEVRSAGLIGCVECRIDRSSPQITEADKRLGAVIDSHCVELGLIMRPMGNLCVMSPPLIISHEQIDEMFAILREALTRTHRGVMDNPGAW